MGVMGVMGVRNAGGSFFDSVERERERERERDGCEVGVRSQGSKENLS